jgi:molybdopterin/thiamine biosynthesis adenylyltransferase
MNEFRIPSPLFNELHQHLFPGDGDEHGAVICAGIAETHRGLRFLAREVILARDGIDYVPGRYGYRALTPEFVARVSNHCAREHLCYFAVHCHGGDDFVQFSGVDFESHQRGYPALLDILDGGPLGALVFAHNAVAGEIWTAGGILKLSQLTIVGVNHRRLYPGPITPARGCADVYHRQSLLFGAVGQQQLAKAKVGIIGLGGVGSLINEWLARLGVGEIIAIDFDQIESSNRSRVVGSLKSDCVEWLVGSKSSLLQRIGKYFSRFKVHIAQRVALAANPHIRFIPTVGDVANERTAKLLRDVDYLFLCADTMQSRLVFNALVHQYVIPGVQIGAKVISDADSGDITDVFSVARLVLPYPQGGCLLCNQLIDPAKLQDEALSAEERREQRYVNDPAVRAPSVITLNALGSAQAANDFMMGYLGLFDNDQAQGGYRMHDGLSRTWRSGECACQPNCPHCGSNDRSAFGRGDRAELPCRTS